MGSRRRGEKCEDQEVESRSPRTVVANSRDALKAKLLLHVRASLDVLVIEKAIV